MAKKSENLKELTDADLNKKLSEFREEVRADRFKMEGAKSKNVKELKEIRKNIARVLTALNHKAHK